MIRRALLFIITLWLSVTMVFAALRILPGDAIENQLVQSGASPAVIEARRTEQGLSDPIWLQYVRYLGHLVRGELGSSLLNGLPVTDTVASRFPATLLLAFEAIIVAVIIGVGAGTYTATKPRSVLSKLMTVFVTLSLAVPIAWSGTLSLIVFAGILKVFSISGEIISQTWLPAIILGFHSAGPIAFVTQTNVRDILASDFVRTAYAKGLPEYLILRRHVFKAALPPVITIIFINLSFLLGGTVITETLFLRPGIGKLLLDSTLQHDYPVVQGVALFIVTVYMLLVFLADILVRLIDPRVTFG